MACHVVRDIELNGPPRAWWCMGFEAFHQTIKGMFNRSNYKSAAITVANFWSMKSARARKLGRAARWVQDTAFPAGELTTNVKGMCKHSPLMTELWSTRSPFVGTRYSLFAARLLHSFTRGSVAVRVCGLW